MNSQLGAIKNIASQTLPNNPCKFGTFVRKITLYPFFCAKGAYYIGLQTMLDITYDYENTHCIKFNKLKSVCMHFEPKCKSWKEFKPKLWLGDDSVQFVEKYKYMFFTLVVLY